MMSYKKLYQHCSMERCEYVLSKPAEFQRYAFCYCPVYNLLFHFFQKVNHLLIKKYQRNRKPRFKCFQCGCGITREETYRSEDNYPVCLSCYRGNDYEREEGPSKYEREYLMQEEQPSPFSPEEDEHQTILLKLFREMESKGTNEEGITIEDLGTLSGIEPQTIEHTISLLHQQFLVYETEPAKWRLM